MYQLDEEIWFPDPRQYHPQSGIIAIGGDLSAERLALAYSLGLFPWFNEGEEILWWCPDPRFVLFPKELKVSKSMRKILRNDEFSFTENQCFEEVMRNCAEIKRNGQDGTWISEEMIKAYVKLNQLGKAKSVEVWKDGQLVGGFYGVEVGNVFCGESMFSKVSNASKAGFLHFVLNNQDHYQLIDCQVYSEHLESLGAREIPKKDFLSILSEGERGHLLE